MKGIYAYWTIYSTDIKKLEQKVKVKGLKWLKFKED